MSLTLNRYPIGITDYPARLDSDMSALETFAAGVQSAIDAATGASVGSLSDVYSALFGAGIAVIGETSYKPTVSGTDLQIAAGFAWVPATQKVYRLLSTATLAFAGQSAATYYVNIDAAGNPVRGTSNSNAVYSVVWTGSAFGTITRLAGVAWGYTDWFAAQTSSTLTAGNPYLKLDDRLEAIEAALGGTTGNQAANVVYSGPASGGAAAPTFRALVIADIPDLSSLYGTGDGTVTSVALTVPAEFSVSGSPITTSGTLAVTKANQNANLIYAGPSSGGAAAPTFRALVAADIPAQPYDVGGAVVGKPASSAVILRYPFPRSVTFPSGLSGSQAVAATAATSSTTFDIKKNGTNVGSFNFAASATTATFTMSSETTFAAGDVMTIVAPGTQDATLADFGFALAGTR